MAANKYWLEEEPTTTETKNYRFDFYPEAGILQVSRQKDGRIVKAMGLNVEELRRYSSVLPFITEAIQGKS